MGRWVYFSSGFDYKFWFGIQPTQDIFEFYGALCEDSEEEEESYNKDSIKLPHKLSWESTVKDNIQVYLEDLKETYCLPEIPWASFESSIDGTEDLYKYICDNINQSREAAKYALGCVIYHQLLYEDDLTCTFEY